jgi:RNA polymerase sigma factor (sigma-70 family)
MADNPIVEFVQRFCRSALPRNGEEQTDGQLLKRCFGGRDRVALEILVWRHAPMVWGVCRRTLASHHEAEDAFQATFLVLLRKAASLRSGELLGNWLYRVAYKTACKARQRATKRYSREKQVATIPEPPSPAHDDACGPELRVLLDEELSRLPEKYRLAVVLCDLEGRSRPDVARQLRLPEGTVGSRLARGRAMLARRLAQRGLIVSATTLAAVWSQQAASGAVPAALLTKTIEATKLVAAGKTVAAGMISAEVSPLAEGVQHASRLARGVLHTTCALALLLGSGVAQRLWTGAWNNSNAPVEWSKRLENVPLTIGDWGGQPVEIDEKQFQAAEVGGYLARRYYQRGTGEEVLMLLVCGKPGPISVHTPDVCFSGSGFELVGELQQFLVAATERAHAAEFIKADMQRPIQGMNLEERLRIYWSWNRGGAWSAPKSPRWAFGAAPALYKMYLIYQPPAGDELKKEDPCQEFMRDLLPELEKALAS